MIGRKAHQHGVAVYDDDSDVVARIAGFLKIGVSGGGTAIVIATPEHMAALRPRLPAGDVVWQDAATLLRQVMDGNRPDPARFDATVGQLVRRSAQRGPIHGYGEMVALLCQAGNYQGAVDLERLWNRLLEREGGDLLCAYPRPVFHSAHDARLFQQILSEHGAVHGAPPQLGPVPSTS